MLGGTLGPYAIEAELGSGGMGSVYLARVTGRAPDLALGTRVAVKVIHPHLLETPNCFKRFLLEGQLGQRVRHVNVVRTYDCDAVRENGDDHHFLVMEYVRGQTLRSLFDELGTVPEELCLHIGRQIARGLSAIHDAGAVHRDLKPENVLITPDHEVKIMDLGVARLPEDPLRLSHTGHFVGSVLYAPPEAFRRSGREIDGRADLHSLGVMLYEIATGRHPYRHHDMRIVLRRVLTHDPQRAGDVNPDLSAFFEEVVHKLCAKDADERFRDALELLMVLEEGEASAWWKAQARALAESSRRALPRIRVPRETGLYGRDDALAGLQCAYEAAREGDGRVVLIDGEAGVGKTRLVDAFVARVHEHEDINFLYGSYPPGGAATVTGAFNAAFREHFGVADLAVTLQDYLRVTPVLVPAFAALLRGESPPAGQEALTKDSLQTVFIHATHGLAAERPTIILIDDLHFAPDEGRALFAALALAVPGHRVLLLGAMRPGVPARWAADVERHEHTQRLALQRLGPKDLARLLEDAFRSGRLARRLGHEIARRSDGNPFFAFEIVRSLRDRGLIRRTADGSWATTEAVTTIDVPSSVADLVAARLAALDDAEADLLEVAACCGFRFDPLVVAAVLESSEMALLRRLGRIERLHHLVRSGRRRFTFDHHQVQEALYAGLSELLRERYHAKIADVLEARVAESIAGGQGQDGTDGALCVELCGHALEGRRFQIAGAYLEPALDHLIGGHLNEDATALATRALEVPGLLDGRERCRILLRLVGRLHLAGRREEERRALEEALTLARGTELECDVHSALGELDLSLARFDDARGHFEQARRAARAAGDGCAEAGIVGRLGSSYSAVDRIPEAREHFEAAIRLARAVGARQVEASASGNLGLTYVTAGAYDHAALLLERHLEIAQSLGSRLSESVATGNLGLVYADQGRTEEARAHFQRKLGISRELGDRMGQAVATANLGMCLHTLGRFDDAKDAYVRCLEIARQIGALDGEANAAGNLGMIFYSLGRYAEAADSYVRSASIAEEIGNRFALADALSNLGTHQVALGSWDVARETLERSLTIAREIGAPRPEGYALHGLALLADEQEDDDSAAYLHAQALARWIRMEAQEPLAETRVAMARIALRLGHTERAAAFLDQVLALDRAAQTPGTVLLATVLRAQLPDGDVQAALDAVDTYEGRVGAADWMEAQMALYGLTRHADYVNEARRVLTYLLEHAPVDSRAAMRENVRLHRAVLAASREAGEAATAAD